METDQMSKPSDTATEKTCKRCGVVVVDTIDGVCDPCFDNHNEEKSDWPSPVVAFQEGLREGAEKERDAIVKRLRDRSAQLRKDAGHPEDSGYMIFQICADEVEMHADMIEKGEYTPNLTKQAVVVRKIDPTKPKVSYRNPLTLKLCSEDFSKGFAAATEAIVKYLIARGEWDSTTGNCLYCNGVGFVDYAQMGEGLCQECHVDLGELITSVEKGEHLKHEQILARKDKP